MQSKAKSWINAETYTEEKRSSYYYFQTYDEASFANLILESGQSLFL